MNKYLNVFLGFLLILGNVNSEEKIDQDSQLEYQWENVSHGTTKIRVTRDKGDEYSCSDTNFLTKVMNFIFPKPTPPPKNAKIKLQLFVQSDGKTLKTQIAENGRIINLGISKFRPEMKTVIIAHGFLGSAETEWIEPMVQAYLNYNNSTNVIVVDWGILAKTLNYIQVAANVIPAGKQVKDLLQAIMDASSKEMKFFNWGHIHLIGFSLGAHLVGIVSHQLRKNRIPWHVDRITGLDPAHPCIDGTDNSLDKSDAPFVDIIHTNGNKAFGVTLGMLHSIGHVDFYLNGGQLQPGCKEKDTFLLGILPVPKMISSAMCSHSRAPDYFIESLEVASGKPGAPLTGIEWDGDVCEAMAYTYTGTCERECQQMGIKANPAYQGQFFVPTATDKPYYDIENADREKITEELERSLEEGSDG